MPEKADQTICEPARDDAQLLDYLMRRFGSQVVKLAYYHIRDKHLAEDIMQEVFCRVYKNLSSFRKSSSYYTWIYRITLNLCKDIKKSAYYRRVFPWQWDMAEQLDDIRLFEQVEGGEVFSAVMDLPLKYRTTLALYYFEDLPIAEIAVLLRITENTARQRLYRARNLLKEKLETSVMAEIDHE